MFLQYRKYSQSRLSEKLNKYAKKYSHNGFEEVFGKFYMGASIKIGWLLEKEQKIKNFEINFFKRRVWRIK